MKIGTIALGVFLILSGLAGLGLAIPAVITAVVALAAGVLVLMGH